LIEQFLLLEGTNAGHWVAIFLALAAAALHATFGALQKGKHDPWLSRGAMDLSYGLIALPFVIFVVPVPEPHMWSILFIALVIHSIYKVLQAWTYSRGAYTVVYPIVRGTSPVFTVVAAFFIFGEVFSLIQILGLISLLIGIFGLAFYNLKTVVIDRVSLGLALMLAVITGLFVAIYTTYDTYGIRSTYNPFTFIFWLFLLDGFFMPLIAYMRWSLVSEKPNLSGLVGRGIIGGIVAYFSFGSIMLATRLDDVGQASVMRETSIIFAVLIGLLFLNENVGLLRLCLITLIAIGAIVVGVGA